MNSEELKKKKKYDAIYEKERELKEEIILYLKNIGSVFMQHDEVEEPMEGAPILSELSTVMDMRCYPLLLLDQSLLTVGLDSN